jgi:sugar lactone lactonase YvrE
MNTEERQLSEMLHRVTPEPPRPVTVEDVASRLADRTGDGRHGYRSGLRARRGLGGGLAAWNRRWVPALAAAGVIAVAAASASIATVLTSGHSQAPGTGNVTNPSSPSGSVSSSAVASASANPTKPEMRPRLIPGGPWAAELIHGEPFTPGTLAAGPTSLYVADSASVVRLDPGTGNLVGMASHNPAVTYRPVVIGSTVWVVESYQGGSVVLNGYDARYLSQLASVTVPVSGQLPSDPAGVLAAGSDGDLYVAAGHSVAVVNPDTRQVDRRISVSAGPVNSVAVSPDGNRLYATVGSLHLLTYNPATGAQLASSSVPGLVSVAGNLVATSGGVWGTAGVGMSQWVWFAPDGDLMRMIHVTQGTGDGAYSIPTLSGGTVWLGGQRTLACADPATGGIKASATIPTDNGVAEHFGGVVVVGGNAYAQYLDQAANQAGVARLTPPAACGGLGSHGAG